jgi:signal transduction histidine kinase
VDRFRTVQVFRNILENALAACPDPVEIRIACRSVEHAGRPALRVEVRDNGPGIAPEHQARIFEPFFTTKVKGIGLGMAIARRNVEAHGGTIEAKSTPGAGAEIAVTLPVAPE